MVENRQGLGKILKESWLNEHDFKMTKSVGKYNIEMEGMLVGNKINLLLEMLHRKPGEMQEYLIIDARDADTMRTMCHECPYPVVVNGKYGKVNNEN